MTDQRPHDELDVAQMAQDELAEMEARWKRSASDLANYRERAKRNMAQQRQHEREAILQNWLPVVDNLERVLAPRDRASLEIIWDGLEAGSPTGA